MKNQKIYEVSTEELIMKEKLLKSVLNIFIVVLFLLTLVLIFMITRNGINPLIAVPITLTGVYLYSKKELKDLRTEIESR